MSDSLPGHVVKTCSGHVESWSGVDSGWKFSLVFNRHLTKRRTMMTDRNTFKSVFVGPLEVLCDRLIPIEEPLRQWIFGLSRTGVT